MAQAARLNLRMQKEVKLLLTDPPPGASFPLLRPESDISSFSLTSILAQIKGPEDTVYAHGTFKIKIQIPERYPFQPPIVTFATPIYHPNIDNGGRICLDILNLPPKGAWQPSLNISTVLTSIGLLLSEPNPDDGLMCEASKEYKYNRQAFDQKARSMTEKYAKAGASESESSSQSIYTYLDSSMMEAKESELSISEVDESSVSHKKLCPIIRKLSLGTSGSMQKSDSDNKSNKASTNHLLEKKIEAKAPTQQRTEIFKNQHHGNLVGNRRKLSLECSGPPQKRSSDYKENAVPNQSSSVLYSQNVSMGYSDYYEQDGDVNKSTKDRTNTSSKKICCDDQNSINSMVSGQISDKSEGTLLTTPVSSSSMSHSCVSKGSLPMPKVSNTSEKQPQEDHFDRVGSGFTNIRHKRLGLAGKKPSLGLLASSEVQEKDNKNCDTDAAPKRLPGLGRKKPLGPFQASNKANIPLHLPTANLNTTPVAEESGHCQKQQGGGPIPEALIVLDSEDSDEEKDKPVRSKLLLSRKRLPGKWNVKV